MRGVDSRTLDEDGTRRERLCIHSSTHCVPATHPAALTHVNSSHVPASASSGGLQDNQAADAKGCMLVWVSRPLRSEAGTLLRVGVDRGVGQSRCSKHTNRSGQPPAYGPSDSAVEVKHL
jgi:hypothetical protein